MKKFSLLAFVAVLIIGGFAAPRALAMPDITAISTNCTLSQSILGQIEKVDTGSRINRGHDYNELLELMFAMNARLAANKIAAPALTSLASEFEQNLAVFRLNYDNYSDILSDAIDIKCADKPTDFYNKLESVRNARLLLKENIATLGQNIDNFYSQFDKAVKGVGL